MLLQKWNWKEHKYEDYEIPDNWNCVMHYNLDKMIDCVQCGKMLRYDESYTSLEVHNEIGFGYAVCKKCYKEEWEREVQRWE